MSRNEALDIIKEKPFSEENIHFDIEYVAKKLDWSFEEFKAILDLPPAKHSDYPNNNGLFKIALTIKRLIKP